MILAGVSIATLVGDNGVLSKANTVKEENIHGDVSGSLMLEYGDYEIVSNTEGTSVTFLEYLISKEYVNEDTGIVNVAKTTGQEKILGNGSGDNDVYKLIEEEGYYKLYYFRSEDDKKEIEKFPVSKQDSDSDEESNWEYEVEDDGLLTLTAYRGDNENIIVPNNINGVSVKKAGSGDIYWAGNLFVWRNFSGDSLGTALYYDYIDTVKKITVSEGITEIGRGAFSEAISLEEIVLPKSLEKIGNEAFFITEGSAKIFDLNISGYTINIPSNVVEVGSNIVSESATVNVEFAIDEIPDTWDENWSGSCTNITYGVDM